MLHLDLDGFKQINDFHGHAAGDELLQHVARTLHDVCRNHDLVARVGGDEFVIVAQRIGTLNGATTLAERILDRLRQPVTVREETCHFGGSIGIDYRSPQDSKPFSFDAMLINADVALYRAKEDGKDRVEVFFAPEMEKGAAKAS